MKVHLNLMPKPRLIAMIRHLQTTNLALRDELAVAEGRMPAKQRAEHFAAIAVTPQEVRDAAQALLNLMPREPLAAKRRAAISQELLERGRIATVTNEREAA